MPNGDIAALCESRLSESGDRHVTSGVGHALSRCRMETLHLYVNQGFLNQAIECQAAHCSGRDIAPLDVDRDAFSYSVLTYRRHQYQWCQQLIVLAVTLFHWMLTEMPSATLC